MGKVKNLLPEDPEEGAPCPFDPECPGVLELAPSENCSCHISPPCGSCLERPFRCTVCKEELECPKP